VSAILDLFARADREGVKVRVTQDPEPFRQGGSPCNAFASAIWPSMRNEDGSRRTALRVLAHEGETPEECARQMLARWPDEVQP
jgi:hypothetical protein